MLGVLIDAAVLMLLLQVVNEDQIGLGTACLVAVVASIGTGLLALGLVLWLGAVGIVLAGVIAAVVLGIAVSALFGVEIKRSMLIGGLFMVVHLGVGFGMQYLLSA